VNYDLVIIGGGPAGLTAGLYAARAQLNVLLVEKLVPGGQMVTTERIDNYPGFPEGIGGPELSMQMKEQAERFGLQMETDEVLSLEAAGPVKTVHLSERSLTCRAVIVAAGASPKRLGVPGEAKFWGRGVSSCAVCDGPFHRGRTVAAVGGGDTAIKESLFLTRFVEKVVLIHRRDQWRAEAVLRERAAANGKIEPVWNAVLKEIHGEEVLTGLTLLDLISGESRTLSVSACFIWIGIEPNTAPMRELVKTDEAGFILTDSQMRTSLPGVFAAGDIRAVPTRQIAGAVGDGAMAAFSAQQFIEGIA
jgi:thioredoxin reductase (NADPH)